MTNNNLAGTFVYELAVDLIIGSNNKGMKRYIVSPTKEAKKLKRKNKVIDRYSEESKRSNSFKNMRMISNVHVIQEKYNTVFFIPKIFEHTPTHIFDIICEIKNRIDACFIKFSNSSRFINVQ
jgi:hypothetical protein